jgi:hypothetical protein
MEMCVSPAALAGRAPAGRMGDRYFRERLRDRKDPDGHTLIGMITYV